jgi:hypothetical protein
MTEHGQVPTISHKQAAPSGKATRPHGSTRLARATVDSTILLGAVSALCLGATLGCRKDDSTSVETSASAHARPSISAPAAADSAAPKETVNTEKDCCMGLNDCRGKGGCAVPESHDCRGKNECKGRGGCNAHCPM